MSEPMIPKPLYTVQVRELVAFVWRRGGLGGERLFVRSDRALAGTRGHQRIQKTRPDGYQKEVPIVHDVEAPELTLRIQGRIDGLFISPTEVVLEEIKTVEGAWDRQADPLHWAQAKCYAFIYLKAQDLQQIAIQLTYLELETGAVCQFRENFSEVDLEKFFNETTVVYLEWVRERHLWCEQRDATIRRLDFPFPGYRPGQRKLAVAAYRTLAGGGRLFVEAPTGIGKTVSVIYPALKALAEGKLERIFYLTARTVGRTVAEKAFADLRQGGLRLRTVTLTAREKICVREGVRCDPSTCPLAIDYYDRNKAAMRDALGRENITRAVLETVSQEHQVCPFELSLDISSWVDAVVCDYNYVFDPKAYLRRHFDEETRPYVFLVDEAHNLVDRAREMFSCELHSRHVREVGRAIRSTLPCGAKMLTRLESTMRKLGRCRALPTQPATQEHEAQEPSLFTGLAEFPPKEKSAIKQLPGRGEDIVTTNEPPVSLLPLIDEFLAEAEIWLATNQPAEFREDLLELYFTLQSFRRTSEAYDERYVTIIESGESVRVRLFCLDPSYLLRKALDRGKAAVFFSATLRPINYYRALISGGTEDPLLELPSPFAPENLSVLVQDRIPTHFKARAQTLENVVDAIGTLVEGRAGNYLVYFPSYQYLNEVQGRFELKFPAVQLLAQRPAMTEPDREAFLAAFDLEHEETLVGFAVMGGIFGEGIDLVGDRLIGAIIVGVGLPQICVERDLIRDYFQERIGSGFDFAYTFPGMNRVLQSSGRVIRSETDRGVVLLIDCQFAEARYRRLFPPWWQRQRIRDTSELRQAVDHFWHSSADLPEHAPAK